MQTRRSNFLPLTWLVMAILLGLPSALHAAKQAPLTAFDIYSALGLHETDDAVQALLRQLGGVTSRKALADEQERIEFLTLGSGAEADLDNGLLVGVTIDLKAHKGRLPFDLRAGMGAKDLAPLFPEAYPQSGKRRVPSGYFVDFYGLSDEVPHHVKFRLPRGYCHWREDFDSLFAVTPWRRGKGESEKAYLVRIRPYEDHLRQLLCGYETLLHSLQILNTKNYRPWAYELQAQLGAYDPQKGILINFRSIGRLRRVQLDPSGLADFMMHFPDAQVLISCTPLEDDCDMHVDQLELLQVLGQSYRLLPAEEEQDLDPPVVDPHVHGREGAWHGE